MNTTTNRLAQLIANAADKELAVRQDGQPRRQDKAAAEAIEAEYLFIPRSEIPKTAIIERDGKPHVEVDGSDAGTWPMGHPKNNAANNRRYGLEYLAAAEGIERWHSKQEVLKREREARREQLRLEIIGGPIECTTPALERAIDRILELEGQTNPK